MTNLVTTENQPFQLCLVCMYACMLCMYVMGASNFHF